MRRSTGIAFLWILCTSAPAWAQKVCSLTLGEDQVHVAIHQGTEEPIHFLNLHDDENTSVEAALAVIGEKGGYLTELKHSGERLLAFSIASQIYKVDPNRMFTSAGRIATLQRNSSSGFQAEQVLQAFADSVLQLYRIKEVPCIVTLHNNSPDDFSVKSYLPGGIYDKEARRVHFEAGTDPDDFVLVTEARFYRFFKRRGINAVLQSKRPSDDGSLSVYAELHRIPYINIEAESGHLKEQKRLIRATYRLLLEKNDLLAPFRGIFGGRR